MTTALHDLKSYISFHSVFLGVGIDVLEECALYLQ